MGERATIAYIDRTGQVRMTTVQWSRNLDSNFAIDLSSRASNSAEDSKRMEAMFKKITEYGHISAVEPARGVGDGEHLAEGSTIALYGAQNRTNDAWAKKQFIPNSVNEEDKLRMIQEYNLDTGMGAIYDARKPNKVSYFYEDPDSRQLKTEELTVAKIKSGNITSYHSPEQREYVAKKVKENRKKVREELIKADLRRQREKEKAEAPKAKEEIKPQDQAPPASPTKVTYHVNPGSGKPGRCTATVKGCPFGGANEHYDSALEARAAYEQAQSDKGNSLTKFSKKK